MTNIEVVLKVRLEIHNPGKSYRGGRDGCPPTPPSEQEQSDGKANTMAKQVAKSHGFSFKIGQLSNAPTI